jgi:hypothetical protein
MRLIREQTKSEKFTRLRRFGSVTVKALKKNAG